MRDYHRRWDDPDAVGQFADKSVEQFFRSEIHFIKDVAENIDSVLDIEKEVSGKLATARS